MKRCFVCEQTKPFSEFYLHPKTADGFFGKCKECHKAAIIANRNANAERYRAYDRERGKLPHRIALATASTKKWRAADKRRNAAHLSVARALKIGILARLPCWVCGKSAEAHHPDYSMPLDVVWLCSVHHKILHTEARTYV